MATILLSTVSIMLLLCECSSLLHPFTRSTSLQSGRAFQIGMCCHVTQTQQLPRPSSNSIGGLVVKLAVAMRFSISDDSASPGFDSRPMHRWLSMSIYFASWLPIMSFL